MRPRLFVAIAMLTACLTPAVAQETAQETKPAQPPELALELNALTPSATGCRISLVATNDLGTELQSAGIEIALFGVDGGIDRLLALDLQAMPAGKTRVLQFDIPQLACDSVGQVLINDVTACAGGELDPALCLAALTVTSRLDVSFGL